MKSSVTSKDELLGYMQGRYALTRWPFFKKVELLNKGATDDMLWALYRERRIGRRRGASDTVIELLDTPPT